MRRRALAVTCWLALAVGCGPPLRSDPSTRYVGMLLDARDLGAREIQRASADDPAVADWIAREGSPDFILSPSAADVELIYYGASKVVLFHRPEAGAPSQIGVADPLPTSVQALLPPDLRAGTGAPFPTGGASCWSIDVDVERCRTCCQTAMACTIACATPAVRR